MENNVAFVQHSDELHDGARALVMRAIDAARVLITHSEEETMSGRHEPLTKAGRKASMPMRTAAPGESADAYVEGEPMMRVHGSQELREG